MSTLSKRRVAAAKPATGDMHRKFEQGLRLQGGVGGDRHPVADVDDPHPLKGPQDQRCDRGIRPPRHQRLHAAGCFVMPNPWDAGSARALEQMGFKALATTSAGLAWTLGRADTQITRDQVLDHLRLIVGAVTVPVNADFEGGYAVEPADVATNVSMAADTGIAGLSIEDASGDQADQSSSKPSRRY